VAQLKQSSVPNLGAFPMFSDEYNQLRAELDNLKSRLERPELEIVGFQSLPNNDFTAIFNFPDGRFEVKNVGLLPLGRIKVLVITSQGQSDPLFATSVIGRIDNDLQNGPLWPGETRSFTSQRSRISKETTRTIRIDVFGKTVLEKMATELPWSSY
jgi:hypothetical protein